jgi:prevent-host-death family protein
MEIGTFEAKTRFSELIESVRNGAEIVVTKRGVPVARILPYASDKPEMGTVLRRLDEIRGRSIPGPSIRELIDEGRR